MSNEEKSQPSPDLADRRTEVEIEKIETEVRVMETRLHLDIVKTILAFGSAIGAGISVFVDLLK
ncbi:MAG: hypothetical protein GKR90_25560 [Pseudomonadales bacterium]|nr:hypothetical protein [Pseudomonadales bacterium]